MGAPDAAQYYAALLKEHGTVPAAIDSTPEGQRLRFNVLLEAIGPEPDSDALSILDVGCGYGAFLEFLRANDLWFMGYTGVDICPEMICAAQDRYCNSKFEVRDIVANPFPRRFDFVVASGLFQFNYGYGHVESLIAAMWAHTEQVLAFNMLSHKAQTLTNGELFADPWRIGAFCHKLTPFVNLRHDYLRHDFTVALRRGPEEDAPVVILPAPSIRLAAAA